MAAIVRVLIVFNDDISTWNVESENVLIKDTFCGANVASRQMECFEENAHENFRWEMYSDFFRQVADS